MRRKDIRWDYEAALPRHEGLKGGWRENHVTEYVSYVGFSAVAASNSIIGRSSTTTAYSVTKAVPAGPGFPRAERDTVPIIFVVNAIAVGGANVDVNDSRFGDSGMTTECGVRLISAAFENDETGRERSMSLRYCTDKYVHLHAIIRRTRGAWSEHLSIYRLREQGGGGCCGSEDLQRCAILVQRAFACFSSCIRTQIKIKRTVFYSGMIVAWFYHPSILMLPPFLYPYSHSHSHSHFHSSEYDC